MLTSRLEFMLTNVFAAVASLPNNTGEFAPRNPWESQLGIGYRDDEDYDVDIW
jgi:hypothetical protein